MPLLSGRCKSQRRLEGKTAVVTGCNTGIGKETVRDFYLRGARVVMACRDLDKAEAAKKDIETSCAQPDEDKSLGELVVKQLDLSALSSVRRCADDIRKTERSLDILINNAGVMVCAEGKTEDGFETHLATNHLGHFLFTLLLMPLIKRSVPARIVNLSSFVHTNKGSFDITDLNFERRRYNALVAYAQSKVANILFAVELANKLKENHIDGINTYSVHPGVIATNIGRTMDNIFPGTKCLWDYIMYWFIKSPKLGAQTTIYCAVDEECANETGLYYSDCEPVVPAKWARDTGNAKKLWDESIKMVQLSTNPFKE